jgi:hypothetical protein
MGDVVHHLTAADLVAGEQRKPNTRKPRKQTLVSVAKQAAKAGISVARYEVEAPDGSKITIVPVGENFPIDEPQIDLDKWLAKHAH